MSEEENEDRDYEMRNSLYQENIVNIIREQANFYNILSYNYFVISRQWGWRIKVSEDRLLEAHRFWKKDTDALLARMKEEEQQRHGTPKTERLDEFKLAGFLTFWLRRRLPIYDIDLISQEKLMTEDEEFFWIMGMRFVLLP